MSTEKRLSNKESNKPAANTELTYDRPVFTPLTDIYEEGDTINVCCEVPGVSKDKVDISMEDNNLTITAYQDEENLDSFDLIHQGYRKGIYKRSFTVSEGIDREKISAKLENGVLKLALPKSESLKPKQIKISN